MEKFGLKSESATLNDDGKITSNLTIGKLPIAGNCIGLAFFKDGHGYLTQNSQYGWSYLKSNDGGVDFYTIKNYEPDIYANLFYSTPDFINENDAFATIGDGSLCYTKDGGVNWSQITSIDYWKSIVLK